MPPSYPTSAIMRLLSRHPIRFIGIFTTLAITLIFNFSRMTERDRPTYSSRIWGSGVYANSQQRPFEPMPSHNSNDDTPHIKQTYHTPQIQPHQSWAFDSNKLSLEELRTYIAGKEGYYVRDWSLGLGWNNMRYIIEAALNQAKLLNRVLVIPSFVYVRDCEYDSEVCSQYAIKVDREDAVGWDKWNGAPVNSIAWQLPIQVMLDLPLLRSYYPVILTSEFMELHDLDPSNELMTGQWNRHIHTNVNLTSFHVIPNPTYDEGGIFRVDTTRPLPDINASTIDTTIDSLFREAVGDENYPLDWDRAVSVLSNNGYLVWNDDKAERLMNSGGWVVTYTYEGLGGMEYTKSVVPAIRQLLPHSRVRGWVEDFTMDVDVLLLEGEVHLSRKPAGFRFTTEQARDDYTSFVLTYMRPIQPLITLSEKLARRMTALAGGKVWLSAHMRRGDFTVVGWVKDQSLEAHLSHVMDVFSEGRKKVKKQVLRGGIPRDDDPFFIATDERNASNLEYMRQNGAVMLYDLLTVDDRREIGWPLLFTDILGIVEQRVAASSAFFYGHALSSLAGGVLNIRATMGFEPSSWIID